MAGRIDTWRKQKALQESQEAAELDTQISDFNIKREDWKCVSDYKKALAENKRQSIQGRLEKWREENAQAKLTKQEEDEARAYEFQLKTQEREDVLNYRAKLDNDRRQSLAYRLDCARKDKVELHVYNITYSNVMSTLS